MKPARLTLTNELVLGYGLHNQIHNIYDVRSATRAELEVYHDADYLDFLSKLVLLLVHLQGISNAQLVRF